MTEAGPVQRDLLLEGGEALSRGAWTEARHHFEEALQERETPEALEGLGMAAQWLVERETVFAARERAYRLYRERHSPRDAARVATQLAWDYRIFRGEPAIATGWLQRAHDLLSNEDPSSEHGWLALREASVLLANGELAAARELTSNAVELGRSLSDLDLEMTALALDGLVLVDEGQVADGMRRLDGSAAAIVGGDLQDLSAISHSCCYLIFACERVRDFDRAGQWCERLAEFCERYGTKPLFSVCRTHYAGVLMFRGRWHQAEEELRLAAPELESNVGGMAGEAFVGLAELRRRQGRLDEAQRMFSEMEHRPDGRLGCARVALDRREYLTAADHAEQYLRQVGNEAKARRVAGLEVQVRALAALRDADRAEQALAELGLIAADVGTEPLKASALAGEGITVAAAGDLVGARRALEDGVTLYARSGMPYECAVTRIELAQVLAASGRADEAHRETMRATETLEQLGVISEPQRVSGESLGLTGRELEVLALVADGLTDPQIAQRLVISEHTVHRHVSNILVKLSCSSRAAAVKRAAAAGVL
ncbi:MAG: LuxR C-terminal-related transcriptional regulator [Solirubrobacteraceae bacterium]